MARFERFASAQKGDNAIMILSRRLLLTALFALMLWGAIYAGLHAGAQDEPSAKAESRSGRYAGGGDVYAANPEESPLVIAAQKASPAVVSIGGTELRYRRMIADPFFDGFFMPYRYQKQEFKNEYSGTGFIVKVDGKTGYVVTNYHVIQGMKRIFVTLPDRREFEAAKFDADLVVDVALLKIEGEDLPCIDLGDSDGLRLGEWVLAIGNPFGNLIDDPQPTVTVGVVSATKRSFSPDYAAANAPGRQPRVYLGMIQTDAAINPGNSGGPLVNIRGEAVGMNTFIFSQVGGSHGIGFAIPIKRVRQIVDQILKYGKVRELLLDFEVMNLTPPLAQRLGLRTTNGALVRRFFLEDGPASKAGLKPGDLIVGMDDREVDSADEFMAYYAARQVDETITLRVERDGQSLELKYKISEYHQDTEPEAQSQDNGNFF
ncbi:trypsin-like peptidase domain-containing protein [Candidatus Sumerlaeota bacterium]|nr:trypsin-like peptidase domain-containing protein [Candidatus Sumerlaeota bacterium]